MENWLFGGLPARLQGTICDVCAWTGFAFWVGMAARFLFPSRLTKGPWLTFCLGCVGACLGPLAVRTIFKPENFNPIGPGGFFASVAVGVATIALYFAVSFLFPPSEPEDGDAGFEDGRGDGFADGRGAVDGESDVDRLNVPADVPYSADYERASRDRLEAERRAREDAAYRARRRAAADYREREDAEYLARLEAERRARRRDDDYRDRADDYREPRRRR